MVRKLIHSVLVFILVFPSLGQQANFQRHDISDLLPSQETYEIMQDSKGNIWVATDRGVLMHNSVSHKVYTMDDGLPDNTIFGFYEDYKGRIWLRTFNCKICYIKDGRVVNLEITEPLQRPRIMAGIQVDSNDHVKIRTYGLINYCTLKEKKRLLKIDSIIYITKHAGKITEDVIISIAQSDIIPINAMTSKSRILFNGNFGFSSGTKIFVFNNEANLKKIISLGRRSSLFEVIGDQVYLGFFGGELYRYDSLLTHSKLMWKYSGSNLHHIMTDKEGGSWLATSNGIYYSTNMDVFHYRFGSNGSNSSVKSIVLHEGSLYAGTESGQVLTINNSVTIPIYKSTGNLISGLFSFRSKLYLSRSGTSSGFGILNGGSFQNLYGKGMNTLYSAYDSIYYCGNDHGLFKFENDVLVQDHYSVDLKSRIRINALCLFNDTLLVGGNGLLSYNENSTSFSPYKQYHEPFQTRISDIKLVDGKIVYATRKGIVVGEGNKLNTLTTEDGLINNDCKKLFIDKDSTVWVLTGVGISAIRNLFNGKNKYSIQNYDARNGLPSTVLNDIVVDSQYVWVATNEGLFQFPKEMPPLRYSFTTFINKIEVNNETLEQVKDQELNYKQNNIDIFFHTISFKNQANLQYAYRMLGLDTAWRYTNNTSVPFLSLEPGEYTFEVKTFLNDAKESQNTASISFNIAPPFWLTWWFLTLCSTLFVVIAVWIVLWRIRLIKNKAQIEKRLVELELTALQSQMNPHFTFNTLNSIQLYIAKNEVEEALRYMSKFSKLIRKILHHSRAQLVTIEEEIELLDLYMHLESLRFGNGFDFSINIDDSIEAEFDRIPPMLLQPYIENGIWHGLMHKKDKGEIRIRITKDEEHEHVKCSIRDNGVGRKRSKELQKNRVRKHKSVGMLISHERLELYNTQQKDNVGVNIIDHYSENEKPIGTEVVLTVPLR